MVRAEGAFGPDGQQSEMNDAVYVSEVDAGEVHVVDPKLRCASTQAVPFGTSAGGVENVVAGVSADCAAPFP